MLIDIRAANFRCDIQYTQFASPCAVCYRLDEYVTLEAIQEAATLPPSFECFQAMQVVLKNTVCRQRGCLVGTLSCCDNLFRRMCTWSRPWSPRRLRAWRA